VIIDCPVDYGENVKLTQRLKELTDRLEEDTPEKAPLTL